MNMYIEHTHTCVHTHSNMHTHSNEENTMSDHFNIKSIKYLGISNTYLFKLLMSNASTKGRRKYFTKHYGRNLEVETSIPCRYRYMYP